MTDPLPPWLPPLDYQLSPFSGYTRDHWIAVLARLTYGFVLASEKQGSPARALFPGDRCDRPDAVDGLEAVARIGVAWAAWLHNPSNSDCLSFEGHDLNLVNLLRQALVEGTNPANPRSYWGNIGHMDQRIVEASGIAITVWLSKDRVFETLTKAERTQVIDWLAQVDGKETWPDNWILFPAISQMVRLHLGYPISKSDLDWRLDQMSAFYRGDGWYADGPGDEFDLYNAWMFGCHYLLWAWIDGDRRPDHRSLVLGRARTFLDGFQYFFGANGSYVAWGRSLLGRFGATVCFQLGHCLGIAPPDPGLLRRISSGCLRYFVDHDMFEPEDHYARQGFHGESPQAAESYVAPPSPLSACHALFALSFSPDDPFWTASESALPVEQSDFDLAFPTAGLGVSGRVATGQVLLLNARSGHPADVPRPGYTPKYGKFVYSTHFPFNVAAVGESYAPDAMLALTHDGQTFGHRDTTRSGTVAPGFISCSFDEVVAGQPEPMRVAILLWGDVQIRLAFIQPTLPVRAFEAPGALGCNGAACVVRRSDPDAGWEYAEAAGRANGIQRIYGYTGQQSSAAFLDQSNLNLAYPYSEQPVVFETQATAMPRLLAAASLVRPAPFDPSREFAGIRVTAWANQSAHITLPDGGQALVRLGGTPNQSITLNGILLEGQAIQLARVSQNAHCISGVGLSQVTGIVTLSEPGTLQLSKQSSTATRLVTDVGLSITPNWLDQAVGNVQVRDLGIVWRDVSDLCPDGHIPPSLVRRWSQQTQRTLVEFRFTA